MKSIILTLFAMLSLNACGTKQSDNNNKTMNNGKSIVVFFSHAGENYSVGNIEEGNTKLVADIICEQTGADRLEIICLKDYNMTYNALCDLAKEEQQKDELPDSSSITSMTRLFSPSPLTKVQVSVAVSAT